MPRPHVIRIWQTVVLVEAVARRQELRRVPEMPLAERGGRVAARFEHLAHRHFSRRYAMLRARRERAQKADAIAITAGHQGCPRRGADSLRDIKVREANAF